MPRWSIHPAAHSPNYRLLPLAFSTEPCRLRASGLRVLAALIQNRNSKFKNQNSPDPAIVTSPGLGPSPAMRTLNSESQQAAPSLRRLHIRPPRFSCTQIIKHPQQNTISSPLPTRPSPLERRSPHLAPCLMTASNEQMF